MSETRLTEDRRADLREMAPEITSMCLEIADSQRRPCAGGEPMLTDAEVDRFWAKVEKAEDCWTWLGYKRGGYGRFAPRHRLDLAAHRVAYELLVGPIPEGLTLDHLCHTESDCLGGDDCPHRSCVNPDHLEPVTMRENTLRTTNNIVGINARKTHCKYDHELSGDNLITYRNGQRACRTCKRRIWRARWAKKQEAKA